MRPSASRRLWQAEDVHRPGARADLRAGRRAPPRRRSPWRGGRPRAARGRAPGCAASADEWVQPEPCAAPSGWRSPGISTSRSPSKNRSMASSRWPPVTTTAPGPSAWTARASSSTRSSGARAARAPPASARLGVTTVARGTSALAQRLPGAVVEQRRAALGHHHRVEHDRRAGQQVERPLHRLDRLDGAEHPDLHRVDADVLGHRAHLLDDRLRRERIDGRDRDRVLRGDRRDRGHAVRAAAGERLEVGLDAGAAAGVGAGDREQPRGAMVAEDSVDRR